MTDPTSNATRLRETPLEEGLRRYAPGHGDARRVAISEFIVSLLLINRRPRSRPD